MSGESEPRKLRFRWDDGSPVRRGQVTLTFRGERYETQTDDEGRAELEFPHDFVYAIICEEIAVKSEWDIGSRSDLGEFKLRRGHGAGGGGGAELRRGRFRYEDGEPVSGKEVLFSFRDEEYLAQTDQYGRFEINFPHDFVYRIEIDEVLVKLEWDIGSKTELGELRVARPGDTNSILRVSDPDADEHGVRGQLYFFDGTQAFGSHKIVVEYTNEDGSPARYTTDDARAYSKEDGSFFIPTGSYSRGGKVRTLMVDGEPARSYHRDRDGFYTVVMPKRTFQSGGTRGGLITGQVLNEDGSPASGAKLRGDDGGMLRMMFSSAPHAEAIADSSGRFVLRFEGGTHLPKLSVDGHEPKRLYLKRKSGEEIEIGNSELRAGTFNLFVVKPRRFLGF